MTRGSERIIASWNSRAGQMGPRFHEGNAIGRRQIKNVAEFLQSELIAHLSDYTPANRHSKCRALLLASDSSLDNTLFVLHEMYTSFTRVQAGSPSTPIDVISATPSLVNSFSNLESHIEYRQYDGSLRTLQEAYTNYQSLDTVLKSASIRNFIHFRRLMNKMSKSSPVLNDLKASNPHSETSGQTENQEPDSSRTLPLSQQVTPGTTGAMTLANRVDYSSHISRGAESISTSDTSSSLHVPGSSVASGIPNWPPSDENRYPCFCETTWKLTTGQEELRVNMASTTYSIAGGDGIARHAPSLCHW